MGFLISRPSTPRKPVRSISVYFLVLVSIFVAGRLVILLNPNPEFPLSQFQNAIPVIGAFATVVLVILVGFGTMWLWAFRVSERTDQMSAAYPDALVVNLGNRIVSFRGALRALGVKKKIYRRNFFVIVASETGLALYSGYSPPKQATFIPWADVVSIGLGEFTIGIKGFPMIKLHLKTTGGSIYMPITISQPGRDPYHVGKPDLVVRTIDILNTLRVSQGGLDARTVD
ncbi:MULTISPECIES: hypothetical protein [Cryobacterium]|uniref:hypothetical protein n=1 Tax=Cryobacterium TaxID=69578 RepID=UPI000CD3B86A|nr:MULTISPECIES: hypothetical protein [Cryobacterium]POH64544.1 hypothetical protein C3B60_14015 [Cryobacterium zongtaii]TFC46254.1 hypothetical protein E3O57_06920 [Cryobacterium sp. TMN-39-2]